MKKSLLSLVLVFVFLFLAMPLGIKEVKAEELGNYATLNDLSTFAMLNGAAIKTNRESETNLYARLGIKKDYVNTLKNNYSGYEISVGVVFARYSTMELLDLQYIASDVIGNGYAVSYRSEAKLSELTLDEGGEGYIYLAKSGAITYDNMFEKYAFLGYVKIGADDDTALFINAPYNPVNNLRSAYEISSRANADASLVMDNKFKVNIQSYLQTVANISNNAGTLSLESEGLTLGTGATLSNFKLTGSYLNENSKIAVYVNGVRYMTDGTPKLTQTFTNNTLNCSLANEWATSGSAQTTISMLPAKTVTWSNFDLDLTLNVKTSGSTISSSDLHFYSSNPDICDVSNVGKLVPKTPGLAKIYAQASDGSIASVDVELVDPVYRAQDQQICLGSNKTLNTTTGSLTYPSGAYGSANVALWKDDAIGAVSITIDDSITGQFDAWINATKKTGIPVTFIAPASLYTNSTHSNAWKKAVNNGEAVQSHSYAASSSSTYDTWSTAQVWMDYWNGNWTIESVTGEKVNVIGYSYGWAKREYAAQLYISGRSTVGTSNQLKNIDYSFINSVSCGLPGGQVSWPTDISDPEGSITKWTKALYDSTVIIYNNNWYGGWTSYHWHTVGGNSFTTSDGVTIGKNDATAYLEYYFTKMLKPLKDNGTIYFDTYENVAKYSQERDTATITVVSKNDSTIVLKLHDMMDDTLFDAPLTVRVVVDSSWTSCTATQNGTTMNSKIVENSGSYYAVFDMIPDAGNLTLTKGAN